MPRIECHCSKSTHATASAKESAFASPVLSLLPSLCWLVSLQHCLATIAATSPFAHSSSVAAAATAAAIDRSMQWSGVCSFPLLQRACPCGAIDARSLVHLNCCHSEHCPLHASEVTLRAVRTTSSASAAAAAVCRRRAAAKSTLPSPAYNGSTCYCEFAIAATGFSLTRLSSIRHSSHSTLIHSLSRPRQQQRQVAISCCSLVLDRLLIPSPRRCQPLLASAPQ